MCNRSPCKMCFLSRVMDKNNAGETLVWKILRTSPSSVQGLQLSQESPLGCSVCTPSSSGQVQLAGTCHALVGSSPLKRCSTPLWSSPPCPLPRDTAMPARPNPCGPHSSRQPPLLLLSSSWPLWAGDPRGLDQTE